MNFSPAQHATLFACLAREVIRRAGEARGIEVVRRAVRRYGEQRGRRMALRTLADGRPLTMLNFLIYGEWSAGPGENVSELVGFVPDARNVVQSCIWNTTWRENNLLRYGRLYCLEVDSALLRGYNPQLQLEVRRTLSNEGEPCEFIYSDADLTPENLERLRQGKQTDPGGRARMPWEYHTGHLYKTMREVFEDALGQDGEAAAQAGLDAFSSRFGKPASKVVISYLGVDFNQLPVPRMTQAENDSLHP